MNKNTLIVLAAVILVLGLGYYMMRDPESRNANTLENASGTGSTIPEQTGQPALDPDENTSPGSTTNGQSTEPAAIAARKDLAAKLRVPENTITVTRVEERAWTDGCLGLGQAHESCLQALVDGFQVTMEAQNKTYVYRTDKTGESVRAESGLNAELDI